MVVQEPEEVVEVVDLMVPWVQVEPILEVFGYLDHKEHLAVLGKVDLAAAAAAVVVVKEEDADLFVHVLTAVDLAAAAAAAVRLAG
jgi:hypothetical protein